MKKVFLAVGLSIPIFLVIYGILGGFDEIEIRLREDPPVYHLLGKTYKGSHDSDEITDIFHDLRTFRHKYRKDSSVTIVSFDKGDDEDNVHYFISINLKDGKEISREGYEFRQFSPSSVLSVHLSAHPMVLPSVEKVIDKIKVFAKENNRQLLDYSIETYYPDGSISVDFPLELK